MNTSPVLWSVQVPPEQVPPPTPPGPAAATAVTAHAPLPPPVHALSPTASHVPSGPDSVECNTACELRMTEQLAPVPVHCPTAVANPGPATAAANTVTSPPPGPCCTNVPGTVTSATLLPIPPPAGFGPLHDACADFVAPPRDTQFTAPEHEPAADAELPLSWTCRLVCTSPPPAAAVFEPDTVAHAAPARAEDEQLAPMSP